MVARSPWPHKLASTWARLLEMRPKIASVALHRDRRERFWLYARANLHATGGARHVQVSSSADLRSWSNWEVLRFDGVFTGKAENNIYYMQVSASGRQLLGFLPVRACASGLPGQMVCDSALLYPCVGGYKRRGGSFCNTQH